MAQQYYQIQNADLKQIYTDNSIQLVQLATDESGVNTHNQSQQILLQDDQEIILNDGQQVLYQTANTNQAQYQQQPATTHYIIGDDISQQQQQQQQISTQHHQVMEHHQQQQQQQHYQADTQQQQQIHQDHQQQIQTVQQPQQIYYTTDHQVHLQPGTIIQHSPHTHQQHQAIEQQQMNVQQQQQQYQHQIVHQQQHAAIQQQAAPPPPQPPQPPQIVYRMQPQQQQQTAQQIQQQTQLINNAHVIVQQPTGQVLIQSPSHQEIIMRQQPMQTQQRLLYNNRVVYSPQTQSQTIIQTSQPQQQQQQHIHLQTAQIQQQQARLVTRLPAQQSPQHQQQILQQQTSNVVFHSVQKPPLQQMQMQIQQQQQQSHLVNTSPLRGGIRPKVTRGGMTMGATPTLITRVPAGVNIARAIRPPVATAGTAGGAAHPQTKGPRARGTGTPRARGQGRGGRGGAAGRGATVSPNMTQQVGTNQTKAITLANQGQAQIRTPYRPIVDSNAGTTPPQHHILITQRAGTLQTAQRFRSPGNQQSTISSTNSSGTGNFDMDLEDSIQAVVVKKEHQKPIQMTTAGGTTLTTYFSSSNNSSNSSNDDETRMVRTQSGAVMSLADYKKRSSAGTLMGAAATSTATLKGPVRVMTPIVNNQVNKMQQMTAGSHAMNQVPTARVAPQPRMMQPHQQQPHLDGSQQGAVNTQTTTTTSSSVLQTSHNNYEIQTHHVLQNRSGQQMAEKDRNSAKMLVILVSGEQRLITFTLPRESCTVQDLLEQVGVPFDNSTTIQCVENPGANIDFVVTVGFSVQESPSELISRAEQSLQMREGNMGTGTTQPTATSNMSNTAAAAMSSQTTAASGYSSLVSTIDDSSSNTKDSSTSSSTTATVAANSATTAAVTKTVEEVPRKIIQGFYAICQSCGFSGCDHAKCERCKRVFNEPPKRVPMVKSAAGSSDAHNSPTNTSLLKSSSSTDLAEKKRSVGAAVDLPKGNRAGNMVYAAVNTAGRGRGGHARGGRARTGRRAEAEPVILTLSSDEENDDEASNKETNLQKSNSNSSIKSLVYKPLPFEAFIPEKDETAIYKDFKRSDVTDLSNYSDKLITAVQPKLMRIGNYCFETKEVVTFTSKGVRIVAPVCNNSTEMVTLHIQKEEVVKIIGHLSKTTESMLCLYPLRTCFQYIKDTMKMDEESSTNNGQTLSVQQRKIIIQLESMTEHAQNVIKSIWDFFDEVTFKDSQEILKRASEMDKQTSSSAEEKTQTLNPNEIRQLLIYPPGKGGISINTEDYMCLATDQYLNDIIIDFYLKWVHQNIIPAAQREKTFIFSTFFYKRLTTLSRHSHDKDVKQTAAQKRHARVQNWTKNVNLFDKDYIIIPINEQSHWFLAIICFPTFKGPVTFDTHQPVEPQQLKKPKGKKVSLQIGNTTITPLSKRGETSATLAEVCALGDDDSERDEAEGDESDLASDDSDFEANSNSTTTNTPANDVSSTSVTNQNSTPPNNNNNSNNNVPPPIKQPLILIFDSLAGASRSRVVATLRDYLSCEYRIKQPNAVPHIYNKDNMPGHCVKVPQQNNFTDCGLFLLQYVEHFFNDPIRDYRVPIKQLNNWFDNITVTRKREEISDLLIKLINEKNGPNQKLILPEIPFPTLKGVLVEPPEDFNIEFEEDNNEEDDEDGATTATPEEEDDSQTAEMDVDEKQSSGSSSSKKAIKSQTTSAVVPTQGRKIVVKRRLRPAAETTPNTSRNSLKIRKIEQ